MSAYNRLHFDFVSVKTDSVSFLSHSVGVKINYVTVKTRYVSVIIAYVSLKIHWNGSLIRSVSRIIGLNGLLFALARGLSGWNFFNIGSADGRIGLASRPGRKADAFRYGGGALTRAPRLLTRAPCLLTRAPRHLGGVLQDKHLMARSRMTDSWSLGLSRRPVKASARASWMSTRRLSVRRSMPGAILLPRYQRFCVKTL